MNSDPVSCLSAIQAVRPDIPIHSLTSIEDGWDFFVLDVNNEWIFRFPRRPQATHNLEKEAALLPHLERLLPVAVPHYEIIPPGAAGTPAWGGDPPVWVGGPPLWVGYHKIPGVPLDAALTAHPSALPALAQHIGEILTAMHDAALPWTVHRLLPRRTLFDWKRQYLDRYHQFRAQVFPLLSPSLQGKAAALWEGYLRPRAHFHFAMALIHADLGAEHILCDPQKACVTGILDWEDACTGDPALDFVGLLQAGGEAFVNQVLGSYRRDPGSSFWSRLHFYTKIVPFYEIQFGLEGDDPQRTQAGLERLQRSLDD